MKNFILLLSLLFSSVLISYAQGESDSWLGTYTFFSEEGEQFTLYIDGEQKNATPTTKVEVPIKGTSFNARAVFADAAILPIKKQIMRWGKDCTYSIVKNKKGEYIFDKKSCTGALPTANGGVSVSAPSSPQEAAGKPALAAIEPTKLSAKVEGDEIILSDGRRLAITRTKANWPDPHVIMKNPIGAKVVISYDDGKDAFNTEVPFDYTVKNWEKNNVYFKLTVDEGGPDKTWFVRLQHGTAYIITLE
jgi:hypothetical protein